MAAIYLVETPTKKHLVEAEAKSTAINHVIKDTITASPVTASEVVQLMGEGLKVEKAGKDLAKHTDAAVTRSADVAAQDVPGNAPAEAA